MFGTLSIQSKEPVTFVENSDLASVLSRNRQERPHVSCHLCRARKTRCSGEPTGCDKCVAIGAECQYPSRPSRRKKRSRSAFQSQQDVTMVDGTNQEPMNKDTYSNPNDSSIGGIAATDVADGVGHGHQAPAGTTAEDLMLSATNLFDFDDEPDGDAQHLEHWLSSGTNAEAEVRAPSASARSAGLDGWPDLGALSSGGFGEISRHWDPLADDQLPSGSYQRQLSEPEEDANEVASGAPNDARSMAMESVLASLSAALASPRPRPSGGSSSRSESLDQHRSGLENPNSSSSYRPPRDSRKNPWPPSSSSSSLSRANSNGHGSMPVSASDIQRRSIAQNLSNNTRHRTSAPQSSVSASASSSVSAAGAGSVGRAASNQVLSQQRENCRCAKYSAALLELLEELGANMGLTRNPASMGVLLGLLRSALARCKEALELEPCRACKGSSQTERLILLTLLLQFMSNMYERVVESCVAMIDDMVNENHDDAVPQYLVGSTPSPRSSNNQPLGGGAQEGMDDMTYSQGQRRDAVQGLARAPGDAMEDLWFSTYHIQSSCERLHVLTTLVTVQITELSYLLGNPKLRAGGRQNQLAILASIEKVTSSSRRMLRMSIDRAIASKEQH